MLCRGGDRTRHDLLGCVVATHGVDGDGSLLCATARGDLALHERGRALSQGAAGWAWPEAI